jgi:hypothetical protein
LLTAGERVDLAADNAEAAVLDLVQPVLARTHRIRGSRCNLKPNAKGAPAIVAVPGLAVIGTTLGGPGEGYVGSGPARKLAKRLIVPPGAPTGSGVPQPSVFCAKKVHETKLKHD